MHRIGLIGAGWITQVHAAGWHAAADRATVVGVADVDAEAAARLAAEFDAASFTDYRQMLDEAGPDAVDICVPPHLHLSIVSEAASRGIHVLCEKPIARDLDEADQIGAALERAGIVYVPAHDTIFYPTVRRAREYLRRSDLGALSLIRSWECDTDVMPSRFGPPPSGPEHGGGETWRASRRLLGGGALIDGGFHGVYRLLYLAPYPVRSVAAMTGRFHPDLTWEGEDTAALLLQFEGGTLGELIISYAFDAPTTGDERLFTVVGRDGILSGDEARLTLRLRKWDRPAVQRLSPLTGQPAWRETFVAQAAHFLDVLDGRVEPVQAFDDARRALAVVRAAYQAAESGQVVEVQ